MHGSDALTAMRLGVVERVTSDAFRGVPSDQLDGLDDTINNFVLDTRVLSLGVLTDEDSVDVVVWGLESLDGDTWTNVGKEVEGSAERQVQGDVALSNYKTA